MIENLKTVFKPGLILCLAFGFWIASNTLTRAQEIEKANLEAALEEFKTTINKEFDLYKSANDSLFLLYLADTWDNFRVFSGEQRKKPKPLEQPSIEVTVNPSDSAAQLQEKQGMHREQTWPGNQLVSPGMDSRNYDASSYYVNFFGRSVSLPASVSSPKVDSPSKDEITGFFRQCSEDPHLPQFIRQLQEIASELKLNDWGYFNLVKKAAIRYTMKQTEQKLFAWYILLKSDYNVKCGYNTNSIFLLVETENKIFNVPYVSISGTRFYIFSFDADDEPMNGLQSYSANYPGKSRPISFFLKEYPELNLMPFSKEITLNGKRISILLNKSIVDFLGSFPNCELSLYFQTPLSPSSQAAMDKLISPMLIGKSPDNQVEILLDLVQHGIPYKQDMQQFGEENYLFPDETMFYPFADCEDRAALFARLVRHFTRLEVVGLDYPDHVSAAVKFNKEIPGDYILVEGERFYICDPTYIGAKPGMAMEGMKDVKPIVIPVL